MKRRLFIPALAGAARLFADEPTTTLRGKLIEPAVLLDAAGKRIRLAGDGPTLGVLRDARVVGNDFEIIGRYQSPGEFTIGPIHTKSMFVWKGGKRLYVTYWCAVCSIRTYTPGKCWCCQEETELDLRERDDQ